MTDTSSQLQDLLHKSHDALRRLRGCIRQRFRRIQKTEQILNDTIDQCEREREDVGGSNVGQGRQG